MPYLTASERAELNSLLRGVSTWKPQPGPQTQAYYSTADVLFYGGAAHGGKTDLLLGLARNEHHSSIIFRRIAKSLKDMVERSRAIYAPDQESGEVNRFNESVLRWRLHDGRIVYFDGLEGEDDVLRHQGRSRDFYGFDELPEFSETQFRYVIGWNRTTIRGQRCRVVGTGNPPTTAEGEWVIRFFAPWLDPDHPRPAKPGELRWFTIGDDGRDVEVPDNLPRPVKRNGQLVRDKNGKPLLLRPKSRTFIPALPQDNAYTDEDYLSQLNAMPEPLRSKMLFGDFRAGRQDGDYQVIPSAWVNAAQARWTEDGHHGRPMTALGVDVARGGADQTTIARRHGNWFAPLLAFPGRSTPDGPAVATLVLVHRKDDAVVNIDVIAVGSSPFDSLRAHIGLKAVAMNAAEGSDLFDKSGKLGFVNQRAEWWWKLREALEPGSGQDLALPPDAELRADLCAPRWRLTARGIQLEAKDEVKKRIGRSPDKGDALVYAHAIKMEPGAGLLQYYAEEAAKAKEKRERKDDASRAP